jgi:hypothetical protein
MAEFTRVNGLGHAPDVLYDTLQIRGWRVEAPGVDLGTGIGSKAEKLMQEFGTTGALMEIDADTLVIIGDSHTLDADIVARRADRVLGGTGVLTGAGTTAIVEVAAITTLFGIVST